MSTTLYPPAKEKGAVLILVAISIVVFIGIAALAIDIGYLLASKNELQNAADAAALAGAGKLGNIYLNMTPEDQKSFTCDSICISNINNASTSTAQKNISAGEKILLNTEDIKIGHWDGETKKFNQTLQNPNAVSVTTKKDGNVNSFISTFFAKIFNKNNFSSQASATAALTGPSYVEEGELEVPIGLSNLIFPDNCGSPITFGSPDSCASWDNFIWAHNTSEMTNKWLGIIEGHTYEGPNDLLIDGHEWLSENYSLNKNIDPITVPRLDSGDKYNFTEGIHTAVFGTDFFTDNPSYPYDGNTGTVLNENGAINENPKDPAPIPNLIDYFRFRDDDGNNAEWTTTVPVYNDPSSDSFSCAPTNKELEILGFARITITGWIGPPDKYILAEIPCEFQVIEGRGGGVTYGNLMGSIPNLVE